MGWWSLNVDLIQFDWLKCELAIFSCVWVIEGWRTWGGEKTEWEKIKLHLKEQLWSHCENSLKEHVRINHDMKLFKCDKCQTYFKTLVHFNSHINSDQKQVDSDESFECSKPSKRRN